MMIRPFAVWLILLVAAVSNGAFRQAVFEPRMSELAAHQLSCLTGSTIIFLIALALVKMLGASRPGHYWLIGVFWTVLTVAFEFNFGHFVMHHPWSVLLHDYNLIAGRLWTLVLAVILISPALAAKLRPSGSALPS